MKEKFSLVRFIKETYYVIRFKVCIAMKKPEKARHLLFKAWRIGNNKGSWRSYQIKHNGEQLS